MPAEKTRLYPAGGYQNPPRLSAKTRTLIAFHELPAEHEPRWVFIKQQCVHCTDARCATVCPPQAYSRTPEGIVVCDSSKCIACSACLDECPFGVPALEYLDLETPRLIKCDWCLNRQRAAAAPIERDGQALSGPRLAEYQRALHAPACARACPTGAIEFGPRDALLAEARRRIAAAPKKYIDDIYGEKELGGLGWLYLAAVPFDQLGLPTEFAPASPRKEFGQAWPLPSCPATWPTALAGGLVVGLAWFCDRRDRVRTAEDPSQTPSPDDTPPAT